MALEDENRPKTIKTSHSSYSSSSESLPLEIIFDILSRLPVESLLRCKSVCKLWRSLISDPYFIKYHLTLSTANRAHHHLLVSGFDHVENLKTCPLYDVLCDDINPLELDYPMKHHCKTVSIVGTCNGLICLVIDSVNLVIWNPRTQKWIQLPDRPRFDGIVLHGFGYSESSDDYKVVEITCSFQDRHDQNVKIYSTRNVNWKELCGFPHQIWLHYSNVFLKRALHWIATDDCDSLIVVSLDLSKETYGQLLLPVDIEVVDIEDDVGLTLGTLGDSLCVLGDYSRHPRFCADVWVMKVYGVKDSWFKLVSIPYDLVSVGGYWGEQFSPPLFVLDDGKVVLQFESRLIVFNSKDVLISVIEKFDGCYKACIFVESLVSPPVSSGKKQ